MLSLLVLNSEDLLGIVPITMIGGLVSDALLATPVDEVVFVGSSWFCCCCVCGSTVMILTITCIGLCFYSSPKLSSRVFMNPYDQGKWQAGIGFIYNRWIEVGCCSAGYTGIRDGDLGFRRKGGNMNNESMNIQNTNIILSPSELRHNLQDNVQKNQKFEFCFSFQPKFVSIIPIKIILICSSLINIRYWLISHDKIWEKLTLEHCLLHLVGFWGDHLPQGHLNCQTKNSHWPIFHWLVVLQEAKRKRVLMIQEQFWY